MLRRYVWNACSREEERKQVMKRTAKQTVVLALALVMLLALLPGGVQAADTDWEVSELDDGSVEITDYNGSDTNLVIPGKIGGKIVTSIETFAFSGCSSLKSVTIPESVNIIGDRAFSCASNFCASNLTEISVASGNQAYCSESGVLFSKDKTLLHTYPGGKQGAYSIPDGVTSINDGAFEDCSGLTSVTIPNSVASIGGVAFALCSGLTNVTIPDSVTRIGDQAFYRCSGLTSLTIPGSVTIIGHAAFQYCSSLTSVTIPDSVTSLGPQAFKYCSGLTCVTIPDSVIRIDDGAFQFCSSLTSVTIPNSVTSIGMFAFEECSGLTSVMIPDSVTSIEVGAFGYCSSLTDVYYSGTEEQWSNLKYRIASENKPLKNATIHYNSAFVTITAQPESVTAVAGSTTTFKVAATDATSYQWQVCTDGKTWVNSGASGNKTATLTVPASEDRSGNKYRCIVSNGSTSVTSNAATLTVTAGVKITTQPANATVVEGNNAAFKVVASGTNLTYQWQVSTNGGSSWSNSPADGNKTATLTVPATMSRSGNKYRCIVSSGSTSVTSNAATLLIPGVVKITSQPANATVVEGKSAAFKVVASGTNLTYQWQVSTNGGSSWANSPADGNKTATLTVPATMSRNGYKYRCVVKSGSNSVTSSAATLAVTGGGLKITTQPANATAVEGNNAAFKVVASGTNLTYQWQVCEAGKTAWKDSPATGSKTATLTVPATVSRNGYKYRCVVTNGSNSVTSSAATLTVTASTAPKITAQPKDVTTAAGGNVTFSVTATGTNLTYQWQVCEAGKTTWKDSPATGSKTATLTVPATASRSGYKYRCIVKSGTSSVTSSAATLTVVAVTTQPKSVTQAAGSTATFTVKAQGPNLTYQWQVSTNGGSSWSNSPAEGNKTATLTVPVTASRNGYRYRCVVKSGSTTVTSDAATLTVS